jgi:heme-degrading monooxygenase HmoA
MVLEVAFVDVLPGHEDAFVADLERAVAEVLPEAKGFVEFAAHGWGIERPTVFHFTITWETLEDHTEGFRGSDLFTRWRSFIGSHFAAPPVVEHFHADG